jgi:predicted amidophosphoribosyltransferase
MINLDWTPKTKKCPKCGATLGPSTKTCPLCNDYEMSKDVERHLNLLRKGKIGLTDKQFGRVKI